MVRMRTSATDFNSLARRDMLRSHLFSCALFVYGSRDRAWNVLSNVEPNVVFIKASIKISHRSRSAFSFTLFFSCSIRFQCLFPRSLLRDRGNKFNDTDPWKIKKRFWRKRMVPGRIWYLNDSRIVLTIQRTDSSIVCIYCRGCALSELNFISCDLR